MANVEHGWVLFDLQARHFGLPIRDLLQMVVLKGVVRVVNAPDYIRGVVNLRGTVIPVIDLRVRLGMPSALVDETESVISDSKNEIVMVMQQQGRKMGVIVDAVSAVKDIRSEAIQTPDTGDGISEIPFVKGVARVDGGTRILLDQQRLFAGGDLQ